MKEKKMDQELNDIMEGIIWDIAGEISGVSGILVKTDGLGQELINHRAPKTWGPSIGNKNSP